MEVAVVFMGLAGLGYYLGDEPNNATRGMKDVTNISSADLAAYKPSGTNIYDNSRSYDVRIAEQEASDDLYKKSQNPWETAIVPPYMNSEPGAMMPNPAMFNDKPDAKVAINKNPVVEPFHNNMVPFFGGSVKQNMDMNQNSTLFEYQTGTNKIHAHKKESGPLFQPWETKTDMVAGFYPAGDRDTSRFQPSLTQEGIKPFQPVQVGPGLNQGPTSKPSGGFQDTYRPPVKTVDDLRVNPKLSYEGRVLPAKSLVTNRAQKALVQKNQPDTAWSRTQDNLFRTTGAVTGSTQRSKYIVRPTHRKCSMQYAGAAGPAVIEKPESRPEIQADKRQTFVSDGPRNANLPEGWTVKSATNADISDYGKSTYQNYNNERAATGCRTYQSNVRGVVDRETAPLEDALRDTKKQEYVKYNRAGNVKVKGIKEFPVTNHKPPKTTIKETLIHDIRTGNLGRNAPSKLTVYDPDDVMRRTIKETLIHDPHTGNIDAPKKSGSSSYNPDEWKLRTTLRQQNPYSKWCTAPQPVLTGPKKTTVYMVDQAKTTTKETTVQDTREGFIKGGNLKHTVYDPADAPRVTIKETTIDHRRPANINAGLIQQTGGYETSNYDAKPVSRQYISTVEHFNNPERDLGQGYLTNPKEAKSTLRQFVSDYQYQGIAGDTNAKAMTDSLQYCNAQVNVNRENVLKGRAPTQNSSKVAVGKDMVDMESKHLMPENNNRDFAPQRTYQVVASPNPCMDTKETIKTSGQIPDNRLDPDLLKPFRSNPLTQSLHSF